MNVLLFPSLSIVTNILIAQTPRTFGDIFMANYNPYVYVE